jgi:hypothetical protein
VDFAKYIARKVKNKIYKRPNIKALIANVDIKVDNKGKNRKQGIYSKRCYENCIKHRNIIDR